MFSKITITIFIVVIYTFDQCFSANPYCSAPYSCNSVLHTVCANQPCTLRKNCDAQAQSLPFNAEERQLIMDFHNQLRNKLALGNDIRGGNGAGSNLKALSYDKELEFIAQCHTNGCVFGHDNCRRTAKYAWIGQNVAWFGGVGSDRFKDKSFITRTIQMWYDEIVDCTKQRLEKFSGGDPVIGHFTQLVWANTQLIGCGRTKISANELIIACNYGEGGNYVGSSVYSFGKACSSCGSLTCSSKYRGLCGSDGYTSNGFKNPFQ